MKKKSTKDWSKIPTTARNLEEKFDDGGDISDYFDFSKAKVIHPKLQRVNVDFPVWMVRLLDRAAGHLGVTRQSIIKLWMAERLKAQAV